MTLSPELLAMIADVKPASDEGIKILLHTMSDPFVADFCVGEIIVSSLISRIVATENERDNLGSSLRECSRYRGLAEEQAEIAEVKLREETRIVDRIWGALGISTYEQAGGKEISEIVADWKARAERAEAALSALEERGS